LADTLLFGVADYIYEQNVETKCQQYALATPPIAGFPLLSQSVATLNRDIMTYVEATGIGAVYDA